MLGQFRRRALLCAVMLVPMFVVVGCFVSSDRVRQKSTLTTFVTQVYVEGQVDLRASPPRLDS